MFDRFIKTLAPGWFASVMGSAVAALALRLLVGTYPAIEPLRWGADFFHWTAIFLFVGLTAALGLKLCRYPERVLRTLEHPVEGSFMATFPISMLVMAGDWRAAGLDAGLVGLLWWTGAVLVFLFSYVILSAIFSGDKLALNQLTPAHFIPAVGLVVIPVAGASLAGAAEGAMREVYFGINMMGFGAGVFMYVGLLALAMGRHYLGMPIVGKMIPTVWVHLAPLSVIPLSLLSLLHAAGEADAIHYATFVATAFLGAASWWLVLALRMTLSAVRKGELPFALSWWAFTFPIGALTVLTLRLSAQMGLTLLPVVGIGYAILLILVWLAAAVGTLRAAMRGELIPREE